MSETSNGINNLDHSNELSWKLGPRDFVLKNIKHIPWIIAGGLIGFILAYINIRYATSIYKVQSSLMIKNDESNAKTDRFDELFISPNSINLINEIQLLSSRPVIERVVKNMHFQTRYYNIGKVRTSLLYPTCAFDLEIQDLPHPEQGFEMLVTIRDEYQFTLANNPKIHHFGEAFMIGENRVALMRNTNIPLRNYATMNFRVEYAPASSVVGYFLVGLKIVQSFEQSTILNLSFETENLDLGTVFLNSLMNVYDSLNIEDKNRISINSLNFINKSLDTLEYQLNNLEGNIRKFRVTNDVFSEDDQSKMYLNNIDRTRNNVDEQDVKITLANLLQQYINDKKNLHDLVPINMGIEEPTLSQRITEYNRLQLERDNNLKTTRPENPLIQSMDASLEKIRQDMSEALNNIKYGYEIARNKMIQQQNEVLGKLRSLPGKSMELSNVNRRQKILEDLYSFLLQKKLETSISSASIISNSKVIEPALGSHRPITPNKQKIYTLCVLLGIAIPIGFVAIKELLRDKVNSRIDVEKHTSAPILGEIGHSEDEEALVVLRNSRRFVAEQFRILRSNLKYMTVKKENPSILVTSSFSGDGKSFISINMASVLALSGKKAVIMEFDIRKPKVLENLGMKRKMGITNYIIGRAQFKDILMQVPGFDSLYVIACGPIPPNPAELLLDPKLDELMKEVRANFDVIIMDTAPVGLVSDSVTLGKFADCTLFVVRMGHTYRKILRLVNDLYLEKKLPSISLVLNDVKLEGGYYSGYYGVYGYYGGYGYGIESGYFEKPAKKKMVPIHKQVVRWWGKWFG